MQMSEARKRGDWTPANDLAGIGSVACHGLSCAGVHADYKRDHYIFPRTQSPKMRELEWEGRVPPLKHWGSNRVADFARRILA